MLEWGVAARRSRRGARGPMPPHGAAGDGAPPRRRRVRDAGALAAC
ncbi:hypothetical protein BURPS1710b_3330 [Burkholderia pseudomallei 1710b]|uniref:Uncharacterized protein n=1 Tax=Burkholderia pseudomallei (strain 1710b) TaxID=320372 RepID=Q3JP02_BURP1|nr:hypothetical protein BURPS1710b_3330 [Burkholderia pseudomallei 1710b]